jgi:hypothetical protein
MIVMPIIVPTVFGPRVVTVDPMMFVSHVARNPDHFIISGPITWAMAVVRSIADFDLDGARPQSSRRKEARRDSGDDNKILFIHNN